MLSSLIQGAERLPLPDRLTRLGVEFLGSRTRRKLQKATEGLFGHDGGSVWGVGRYPLAPHQGASA